jgi:hypothetical protein
MTAFKHHIKLATRMRKFVESRPTRLRDAQFVREDLRERLVWYSVRRPLVKQGNGGLTVMLASKMFLPSTEPARMKPKRLPPCADNQTTGPYHGQFKPKQSTIYFRKIHFSIIVYSEHIYETPQHSMGYAVQGSIPCRYKTSRQSSWGPPSPQWVGRKADHLPPSRLGISGAVSLSNPCMCHGAHRKNFDSTYAHTSMAVFVAMAPCNSGQRCQRFGQNPSPSSRLESVILQLVSYLDFQPIFLCIICLPLSPLIPRLRHFS